MSVELSFQQSCPGPCDECEHTAPRWKGVIAEQEYHLCGDCVRYCEDVVAESFGPQLVEIAEATKCHFCEMIGNLFTRLSNWFASLTFPSCRSLYGRVGRPE